jgi:membrane protease YdiL (CAAX protease family)
MEPEQEVVVPTAPPPNFILFNQRGLRAGWRLLIFLGIVWGIPRLLVWGLSRLVPAQQNPAPPVVISPWLQLFGGTLVFLWVLLASFIMSRIERRKMGTYGLPLNKSVLSRFVIGYVVWGFLPLTLVLLIMRGLGVFYFGDVVLHSAEALRWAAVWGLVFLSVGLVEEFLFRGYLLYTLAEGIGFWPATIILAAAFAWEHMGNGGETHIGIVGVFLFAIFAAATLRRTGNLWLAVGAHAGWDWGQSYFYGVNDSGTQVPGHLLNPHIQGPDWLSGGSVGPEGSIVVLIFWALMTVGFLLFYPQRRDPTLAITAAKETPITPL